jgi:hypothetical protein
MRLIYKPFALLFSLIGARLGKGIFASLWSRLDDADPPTATSADASLGKVVSAAALRAATMATVAAMADRAAARTFEYLTGVWPGKEPDKKGSGRKRPR